MDLDRELRSALKRREPPAGFTERLMAEIPQQTARGPWLRRSWMSAAAAVLIAVAGAGSWELVRARQQRHEAERARAELIQALEVTSAKLQATRIKLLRTTGGLL